MGLPNSDGRHLPSVGDRFGSLGSNERLPLSRSFFLLKIVGRRNLGIGFTQYDFWVLGGAFRWTGSLGGMVDNRNLADSSRSFALVVTERDASFFFIPTYFAPDDGLFSGAS